MHGSKAIREGKFLNLPWKSSRTPVSLLWLYRFMMEAFVRQQNRRRILEKRFDYLALVPAAAAICYPFLLNAFHAIVGTQAVSPPPLAIASATFILVVAFVVPFLGIALACRPTSAAGSRRLAYASVASPTLYVFLGVVQVMIKSPLPDEVVWCAIWLAIAIWSQSAREPVAAAVPAVGGWRVVHGVTAAALSLFESKAAHYFGTMRIPESEFLKSWDCDKRSARGLAQCWRIWVEALNERSALPSLLRRDLVQCSSSQSV
jgi:hypothetical protein